VPDQVLAAHPACSGPGEFSHKSWTLPRNTTSFPLAAGFFFSGHTISGDANNRYAGSKPHEISCFAIKGNKFQELAQRLTRLDGKVSLHIGFT
jgi:hypothetical protein